MIEISVKWHERCQRKNPSHECENRISYLFIQFLSVNMDYFNFNRWIHSREGKHKLDLDLGWYQLISVHKNLKRKKTYEE